MNPYHFGSGAVAAAASGNITPGMPAAFATDHVAIVICVQGDNVVSTIAAGWTIVDATNNGAACRSWWAWRRLVAGDAAPLITHAAGGPIIARISVFAGVRTAGNPHDVNSVLANASSATVTTTAVTPGTANSLVCFFAAQADDSSYSGYSGTNPVFAEITDDLTGLGTDASVALAVGIKTDTTTTGARTCTATRTLVNNGHLFVLVNDGVTPTVNPPLSLKVLQARDRAAVI